METNREELDLSLNHMDHRAALILEDALDRAFRRFGSMTPTPNVSMFRKTRVSQHDYRSVCSRRLSSYPKTCGGYLEWGVELVSFGGPNPESPSGRRLFAGCWRRSKPGIGTRYKGPAPLAVSEQILVIAQIGFIVLTHSQKWVDRILRKT